MHELDLLLFACEACARDQCAHCVHLTVGAWCPHLCTWVIRLYAIPQHPKWLTLAAS